MRTRMDSTAAAWRFLCLPALAALAAGAVLLAACGGGSADWRRLPDYNPEWGKAGDGFVFVGSRAEITAVDGRGTRIGNRFWNVVPNRDSVYPVGPKGMSILELGMTEGYDFHRYTHDSALLRPGPHRIAVAAVVIGRDGDGALALIAVSPETELRFEVARDAYYKIAMKLVEGGDRKRFWPMAVQGSCPPQEAGAAELDGACYENGVIVASSNPAHVGKRFNDAAAFADPAGAVAASEAFATRGETVNIFREWLRQGSAG